MSDLGCYIGRDHRGEPVLMRANVEDTLDEATKREEGLHFVSNARIMAMALSPEPEPAEVEQYVIDAAGLCESEARKWESHPDQRTAAHWRQVAALLRGNALGAYVRRKEAEPAEVEEARDRFTEAARDYAREGTESRRLWMMTAYRDLQAAERRAGESQS